MKELAITELKRLAETKEQMETLTNALIEATLSGNIDPLKVYALVKKNNQALSNYLKDVRIVNIITDAIDCYGKEDIVIDEVAYKLKTRKTVDFSNSNEWMEAKARIKALEAGMKFTGCTEDGEQLIYKHSQYIEAKI